MANNEDLKCALQDELVEEVIGVIETYLESDKVKAGGLDEDSKSDIVIAALLTIYANHLAYVAAQEDTIDFTPHIEDSFTAAKTLFTRLRKGFLKDMGKEDPLSAAEEENPAKSTPNKKKSQTVH